jgi:hypothetical protein
MTKPTNPHDDTPWPDHLRPYIDRLQRKLGQLLDLEPREDRCGPDGERITTYPRLDENGIAEAAVSGATPEQRYVNLKMFAAKLNLKIDEVEALEALYRRNG